MQTVALKKMLSRKGLINDDKYGMSKEFYFTEMIISRECIKPNNEHIIASGAAHGFYDKVCENINYTYPK
jgi:hypothetical protein